MKKLLLLLLLLPAFANGQYIFYPFGTALYSTTFTFSTGDSLTKNILSGENTDPFYLNDTVPLTIDTSSASLWQIGNTLKSGFSIDTIPSHGIMTDTLNPYPANANDFFVLKIGYVTNFIVDIWHKYQMDSMHAGGIVEFSTDSGLTWMNVSYCDQIDTQRFYSPVDTIFSGQPAFKGNSNGEKLSRLQFTNCEEWAIRETGTGCFAQFQSPSPIYIRFRFVSDATVDSLSGWMIDSIRIENPGCFFAGGGVHNVANENTISIFPNPAYDDITITSSAQEITRVEITDMLGRQVYSMVPTANCLLQTINVAGLPGGVYFVRVNNTDPSTGLRMTGKFVKE